MDEPHDASMVGVPAAWIEADWPAPAGIRALTTLRGGAGVGVSCAPFDSLNLSLGCGDDPAAVAENRARLQRWLRLPSAPLWLAQTHGTAVWRADGPIPADPVLADAAVTSVPGRVLVVLTADCLPILLCACAGDEIAAVHAGWRGLAAGVVERCIEAMRTPVSELLAWIGPGAGPTAYEVGAEVRAAFVDKHAEDADWFRSSRPGHWWCDLPGLARARLARRGVRFIYGGRHCTVSDPERFFSHRRDGRCGRMASMIWIESGTHTATSSP